VITTLRLVKLLEQISAESAKVLIFIGTKRVADDLTKYLRQDGWPALAIHGDKQQQERDWVLAEFKSGRSPIMIATDVASRGLGSYSFSSPHYTHSSSTLFDSTRTTLAVFFQTKEFEMNVSKRIIIRLRDPLNLPLNFTRNAL
jgi:hypothetical protein